MGLQLEVVIPEKQMVTEAGLDSVTLPGSEGELGILPEHIPLMTTLDTGVLVYQKGSQRHALAIHWGYAQVESNRVTVLAKLAEKAEEIDVNRAQNAEKRAQETLAASFGSEEDEVRRQLKYESKLKRALVRQTAARFK